jgi:hypothetical protein
MAPTTRAAKTAALADQKREIQTPSLPLEVWHLIFLQNTHPKHLWTIGRQVCSTWRSEIPKVIAKKYLEDPNMTQIHSDSETTTEVENLTCLMGSKLIFSHYDSSDKTRAVFKQCSKEPKGGHEHFCTLTREKAAENKSRSLDDFYIDGELCEGKCSLCFGSSESRRRDLPPYSIRIKWKANDTELPGLEVDFARGEISFDWQDMLEMWFREAAILDRRYHDIATDSLQWLNREKPSMARVMLRTWDDDDARTECRKEVRRNRIRKRDNEIHHGRSHSGSFDSEVEKRILEGFQELEVPKDVDPTEDEEEDQMRKVQAAAERGLANIQGCMQSDAIPGDAERYLSLWWEGQLNNMPGEERGAYSEKYARRWLGRQRM